MVNYSVGEGGTAPEDRTSLSTSSAAAVRDSRSHNDAIYHSKVWEIFCRVSHEGQEGHDEGRRRRLGSGVVLSSEGVGSTCTAAGPLREVLDAVAHRLTASIKALEADLEESQDAEMVGETREACIARRSLDGDGWGVSSYVAELFGSVLDLLQLSPALCAHLSMSETAVDTALRDAAACLGGEREPALHVPASVVAFGSYLGVHRSVRLRVERLYSLLRQSLGAALLEVKDKRSILSFHSPQDASNSPSRSAAVPTPPEERENFLACRGEMIVAQQWLMGDFMTIYQSLVAACAQVHYAQRTQPSVSVSSSSPLPSAAQGMTEQLVTAFHSLLRFFHRLAAPSSLVLSTPRGAAPVTRFSTQLEGCRFFTDPPSSLPYVQRVVLDESRPNHLLVSISTPSACESSFSTKTYGLFACSASAALPRGSFFGLFPTAVPSSSVDASATTDGDAARRQIVFNAPLHVSSHVDPMLLLSRGGRLLELVLRLSPLPVQLHAVSSSSAVMPREGDDAAFLSRETLELDLSSPHFSPALHQYAIEEINNLNNSPEGFFRPRWSKAHSKLWPIPPRQPVPLALAPNDEVSDEVKEKTAPSSSLARAHSSGTAALALPGMGDVAMKAMQESGVTKPSDAVASPPHELADAVRRVNALMDAKDSHPARHPTRALGPATTDDRSGELLKATIADAAVASRRRDADQEVNEGKATKVGDAGTSTRTDVADMEGSGAVGGAPCCFENGVRLLWVSDTCMVFQRSSAVKPWGLGIECLAHPEEHPELLPLRLAKLPPLLKESEARGCQGARRGTNRRKGKAARHGHPFTDFFYSSKKQNWFIDTINGIAARHPSHALPWMSSLTQMVLKFRRL